MMDLIALELSGNLCMMRDDEITKSHDFYFPRSHGHFPRAGGAG